MINVNDYGKIEVTKAAFTDMANIASSKVKGIYPVKTGGNIAECSFKNDELLVSLEIKVKQGIDIVNTSARLQNKVYELILEMTGISCRKINVEIEGFVK